MFTLTFTLTFCDEVYDTALSYFIYQLNYVYNSENEFAFFAESDILAQFLYISISGF